MMATKGNVLVVSNMYPSKRFPAYGTFVKHFCEQLEQLNIDYTLCVMLRASSKMEKLYRYIKFYCGSFARCLIGNHNLVYVHYASHSTPAVIAARRIKKFKLIVNVHGSDVVSENKSQEKMQKYTRKSLAIADTVVVPSEYFKEYVIKKYGLPKEKVSIYPSAGIDTQLFHPALSKEESAGVVEKYGLTPCRTYIGCAGRMSKGKGWQTLIKALPTIVNKHDNVEIVIVGGGEEEKEIRDLVSKFKLERCIKWFPLMKQSELAELYRILDVFIFPTERESESLGLVALEAMSSGAIVVSSDFAAPKYYIENGVNGYKFRMGDYKNLSEKLDAYFDMSNEAKQKMIYESIKTAKLYESDNILNDLEGIIHGKRQN